MQPQDDGHTPDGEDMSLENILRLMEENGRPWLGYWAWKDKPIGERNAVREAFAGIGLEPTGLQSLGDGQDPPDCEVIVDGRLCGVEVTELVHARTMKRSIKAQKMRKAVGIPAPHEAEVYFAWERNDLVEALRALFDRKDQPEKL